MKSYNKQNNKNLLTETVRASGDQLHGHTTFLSKFLFSCSITNNSQAPIDPKSNFLLLDVSKSIKFQKTKKSSD